MNTPVEAPTSPFLRLSGELRNKIYSYVFSGFGICVMCVGMLTSGQPRAALRYAWPLDETIVLDRLGRETFNQLVALTLVCRQVHAESRLLPYKYSKYNITLVNNFRAWIGRLDEALQTTIWEVLTDSQKRYLQESRDFRNRWARRTSGG